MGIPACGGAGGSGAARVAHPLEAIPTSIQKLIIEMGPASALTLFKEVDEARAHNCKKYQGIYGVQIEIVTNLLNKFPYVMASMFGIDASRMVPTLLVEKLYKACPEEKTLESFLEEKNIEVAQDLGVFFLNLPEDLRKALGVPITPTSDPIFAAQAIRSAFDANKEHLATIRDLTISSIYHVRRLPPEIQYFSGLESFSCTSNELTSLPRDVKFWTKLKRIYINAPEMKFLPRDVEAWKDLTHANFYCCGLLELPEEVGKWKNLEEISLLNSKITTLPNAAVVWVTLT